jgi:hypothetical protein
MDTPEAGAAGFGGEMTNGDLCALWDLPQFCIYNNMSVNDPWKMTKGTLAFTEDGVLPYDYRFRAGAGNGSTNRCESNAGPLPFNDYYPINHYDNYAGSAIRGRAWHLPNSWCMWWEPNGGGVLRTELFIHTEETTSQGQSCSSEPWCWNGQNDYYSAGCIKVDPKDISSVDQIWHTGKYPYTTHLGVDL